MNENLKAPFVYFGGKLSVADIVWQHFGDVDNYCEPFAGSLAVLLQRPTPFSGTETVNDKDGMVSNFWRSVQHDPDAVAFHADWPVNENDLHARHSWLVGQRESLTARLEGDPDFFDAKIAGWWCWGINLWIGSGFCSGKGPWQVQEVDGVRQLVHLGNAGMGVHRQLVHLGDAGMGVHRQRVHLGDAGKGVHRQRVHLGPGGNGMTEVGSNASTPLLEWMQALSERLRFVRVCSGDWSRVCGPMPTVKLGTTAMFLDPPYAAADNRNPNIYAVDCLKVADDVRTWAIQWGTDRRMRIALCSYDALQMPDDWHPFRWKAQGGYGSYGNGQGRANSAREVIWFSPHCRFEATLFDAEAPCDTPT